MINCSECGRENQPEAKICAYCGSPLFDVTTERASTRALGDTDYEEGEPRWGSAKFNQHMHLQLEIVDTNARFVFNADDVERIVMGRPDPETNELPDVNLEKYGGLDKGVSRRHAAIVRRDGSLHLMDMGSPNGTYLNGQKLVANQPRVLRDGDDIRLGHLVMRVTFYRGPAVTPST